MDDLRCLYNRLVWLCSTNCTTNWVCCISSWCKWV